MKNEITEGTFPTLPTTNFHTSQHQQFFAQPLFIKTRSKSPSTQKNVHERQASMKKGRNY